MQWMTGPSAFLMPPAYLKLFLSVVPKIKIKVKMCDQKKVPKNIY